MSGPRLSPPAAAGCQANALRCRKREAQSYPGQEALAGHPNGRAAAGLRTAVSRRGTRCARETRQHVPHLTPIVAARTVLTTASCCIARISGVAAGAIACRICAASTARVRLRLAWKQALGVQSAPARRQGLQESSCRPRASQRCWPGKAARRRHQAALPRGKRHREGQRARSVRWSWPQPTSQQPGLFPHAVRCTAAGARPVKDWRAPPGT
jgi:hypothetical protein